jgi:hypothetical protein
MRFSYSPTLGGTVFFGGIGFKPADDDMWLLKNGAWTELKRPTSTSPWPSRRLEAQLVWHPGQSALLLIGGTTDDGGGQNVLRDTWFRNA